MKPSRLLFLFGYSRIYCSMDESNSAPLFDIVKSFALSSLLWLMLLHAPPGAKVTASIYRLHFVHGIVSTIFAILYVNKLVPDHYPTMISTSYFLVDLANMLINDFYHKIGSYQKGDNRILEYVHHMLCASVLIYLQYDHFDPQICRFSENPGPAMMLAEASTPFLIGKIPLLPSFLLSSLFFHYF